jgi:hypothetical protein
MVSAQKQTLTYTTVSSIVGFGILRIFGSLFNFIEVAQEVNLYSFISISYPLNLEEFLDFLSNFRFYKNFKFFQFEKNATGNYSDPNTINVFQKKGIAPSFLSNSLSTLLIIFIVPLLLIFFFKIIGIVFKKKLLIGGTEIPPDEKIKAGNHYFLDIIKGLWINRRIILLGVMFSLYLGSLQEMQLFAIIQLFNFQFETSQQKINIISSVLWLFFELLVLIYVARSFLKANQSESILKRNFFSFCCSRKKNKQQLTKDAPSLIKNNTPPISIEQKKDFYPFLFGSFLKEDYRGMSFIFYRIIKKLILPTIYAIFSENINDSLHYLLILYFCSFIYLRVTQPFRSIASNILAELTELGQLNFFFLLKFYNKAVEKNNTEVGLSLGVYMIYSVLFLIIINTLFLVATLLLSFSTKIHHSIGKSKKSLLKVPFSKPVVYLPSAKGLDDPEPKKENILNEKVF